MARTWPSITVELLGGRGEDFWPPPGRILAVGPAHTFLDLAEAINDAFARWDRAHLSTFTLADGRIVTDPATGAEMAESGFGPATTPLDIAKAKVARTLEPGAEFRFTFDLGDDWVHRCEIGITKTDPEIELGIRPDAPLPYWGWGSIPDQYGRRWQDDDGSSEPPPAPDLLHPMVLGTWRTVEAPPVDRRAVRIAALAGDAAAFLEAIEGRDVDDALQQLGAGGAMALEERRDDAETPALAIVNRLT